MTWPYSKILGKISYFQTNIEKCKQTAVLPSDWTSIMVFLLHLRTQLRHQICRGCPCNQPLYALVNIPDYLFWHVSLPICYQLKKIETIVNDMWHQGYRNIRFGLTCVMFCGTWLPELSYHPFQTKKIPLFM